MLKFDVIERLSMRFKQLDLEYDAFLVTNGYLLDRNVTDQLGVLNITKIQVSLDGPEKVHDAPEKAP